MESSSDDLRQALLSPSTPTIEGGFSISRIAGPDEEGAEDVESPPSSFPPLSDQVSPSHSFNVTSFRLSNFLFGGGGSPGSMGRLDDEVEDNDDHDDVSCLLNCWTETLFRNTGLILAIVVLIVWPLGGHSYAKFTRKTDSTFRVLPGSPSGIAQEAFAKAYAINETDGFMDPMHPPLVLVLTATPDNDNNNNNNSSYTTKRTLTHKDTAAYSQARNFSLGLLQYLNSSKCWTWPGRSCSTDNETVHNDDWLRVSSYYTMVDDDLHWIADSSFRVPDGTSVLLQVEYSLPANETKHHKQRILDLMYAIDDYRSEFWRQQQQQQQQNGTTKQFFTVHYTGLKYFASDLALSTRHDLLRMDVLVLPLALLLMGVVLKAGNFLTIWLIPTIVVTTTVCTWAFIMRFVASWMQVSTFVPTVMMSLSLGLGIDYTMFLLARYLEEIRAVSRKRAVVRMLRGSGRVLVLSGITLASTFLGLVLLPLSMLRSIGIGAAIAILSALAVNLTVVPTLLYTPLGLWIVKEEIDSSQGTSTHDDVSTAFEDPADDLDAMRLEPPSISRPASRERAIETIASPHRSLWFRLSRQLLHPYRGIIILLIMLQLLVPVARHATQIKSSISFDLLLPANSPSLQTFHALGKQMGLGSLSPYRILFEGHAANITMTSNSGFEVMHLVLDELRAIDHPEDRDFEDSVTHVGTASRNEMVELSARIFNTVEHPPTDANNNKSSEECDGDALQSKRKPTSYSGISILKNTRIPHAVFVSAKYCSQLEPHCPFQLLHVIDEIDKVATSGDEYATFITATLGTSPFSDEGVQWLEEARATVSRLESAGTLSGINVYIEGSAGIAHDAVNAVSKALPSMIIITSIVVFVLMGIFFRSFFQPIRSIVSISLTLGFSFGLAVLVFQDGMLNWTHFRAFTAIGDGNLCWLVPVMALSIIIGLALDYDVFLISRILEFRLEEYEHKTSVAAGLDATGGVITAAGLIMAFAFGSLMFGSNPVLYQWSFLLTTAVLLDTFVIRTSVVPILTGLAGSCTWWPRKLPEERLCYAEFGPQDTDDVAGLLRTLEASSEYEPLRTNGNSVIH